MDRLIEMCTIMENNGESIRQAKAVENRDRLRKILI